MSSVIEYVFLLFQAFGLLIILLTSNTTSNVIITRNQGRADYRQLKDLPQMRLACLPTVLNSQIQSMVSPDLDQTVFGVNSLFKLVRAKVGRISGFNNLHSEMHDHSGADHNLLIHTLKR